MLDSLPLPLFDCHQAAHLGQPKMAFGGRRGQKIEKKILSQKSPKWHEMPQKPPKSIIFTTFHPFLGFLGLLGVAGLNL